MSHAGFYHTHFPLPLISEEHENSIKERLLSQSSEGIFTLYVPAVSPTILREVSVVDNVLQITDLAVYIGAPTDMIPSGPRIERMCELSSIDKETSEYSSSSYYGILPEHKVPDVSTCTDPNFIFKINELYRDSDTTFIHPNHLLAPEVAASAISGSMRNAWSTAGAAASDAPAPHA